MTVKNNINVGGQISYFRKLKGWSQDDFANKIGVAKSTLVKYEGNRKELGINQIAQIAEALELSVYDLLMNVIPFENINNAFKDANIEAYENKIKNLESEMGNLNKELQVLKRELTDKKKIIALFEKNLADYKNAINNENDNFN